VTELLAEMTWVEARAAADAGAIALLPIGATEAHGPHLPLATDVILSEELARRAQAELGARERRAVIAPSVSYAVTDYAAGFGGTVSIGAPTATQLVAEVCLGLQREGFAKVCLVNSHLEPAHADTLRAAIAVVAARGGGKVAFPDQLEKRWARTLTEEYRRGACHAGRYETSLVLAARPGLVRGSRLALPERPIDLARAMREGKRTFREAGADQAYFGAPAEATAAEGEQIYGLLVAMVVQTVDEVWPIG
jgi:creatinine amidohydrolase